MPFDALGHELLSEEAAAMEAGVLTAQVRLAEDLLGVEAGQYDGLGEGSLEQRVWEEMVVLQVGYQVARGVQGDVLVQQGLGDMQRTYRKVGALCASARVLRDRYFAVGEAEEDEGSVDGGSFRLDVILDDVDW